MRLCVLLLYVLGANAINHDLHGWQATASPPAEQELKLHLSLASTKTAELHELFEAVSDPMSPKYGQYLTREGLKQFCLEGTKTSHPAVEKWLRENDVPFTRTGCGDMLELSPHVDQVERLFGVRMLTFAHEDTKLKLTRTLSDLTLPAEVAPHVSFVSGLFNFPHVNKLKSKPVEALGGAPQVTPALLKKLYGLGDAKFSGKSNASQAVLRLLSS